MTISQPAQTATFFGWQEDPQGIGDPHQVEPDNACVIEICFFCHRKFEVAKGEPKSNVCPACYHRSTASTEGR